MKKIVTLLLTVSILMSSSVFADTPVETDESTLKAYLGFEYGRLSPSQVAVAEKLYSSLQGAEDQETYDVAFKAFNAYLMENGILAPLSSISDLFIQYPNLFTDRQKKEMIGLEKAYNRESGENGSMKIAERAIEALYAYIDEAGLDAEEVMTSISMKSVVYAKYEYKNGKGVLVENSSGYGKEDLERFQFVIDRAIELIPEKLARYFKDFTVNSDGKYNVMAFVDQDSDNPIKWRVALDLKDAFDENGVYDPEYDETIVHELAHVLALNESQMKEDAEGTYETMEGTTRKDALLNQFFEKFWKPIYSEYLNSVSSEDVGSVDAFYKKYTDRFVSDYAATNPEEDFAETVRVFVFGEKPTSNTIADQKIKWLYSLEEMTALRDTFREKIGLEK